MRFTFLISTLLGAILLLHGCGADDSPTARPNFLLIITDDQRHGTVGEFMPLTQKAIFDQGVTFENAFVTTPLCCPSRASILTGMYAHTTGVHRNEDQLEKPTFVHQLQDAGYFTGLAGKYLNSWNGEPRPEFDYWAAFTGGGGAYYNAPLNINGERKRSPFYVTNVLKTYALEFLDLAFNQDKPFALIFSPNAPHAPAIPAGEDKQLYAGLPPYRPPSYNERDVSDKPDWLKRKPQLIALQRDRLDELRLNQLRSLMAVDRAVGELVERLRRHGQLENTVILFTSDNGYFWGEHRLTEKSFGYEPAIHVPMAVRYGDRYAAGRKEEVLVANIDIAPTIYELADIPRPPAVDGLSLVGLLRGEPLRRDWLIIEGWPGVGNYKGVRSARYKYIEQETGEHELYDLQTDPDELHNLSNDARFADVVREMQRRVRGLEGQPLYPEQTTTVP